MTRILTICLILFQSLGLSAQVEKIPLPAPSDHPYQQILYLSSQRQWSAADSMIDHAIKYYEEEGEQDSILVCHLRRAWLLDFKVGWKSEAAILIK